MKTRTQLANKQKNNSIVLYVGHERLIHRYTDFGSVVEITTISEGSDTFGASLFSEVEHEPQGVTPNDIFKHLHLDRFVQ